MGVYDLILKDIFGNVGNQCTQQLLGVERFRVGRNDVGAGYSRSVDMFLQVGHRRFYHVEFQSSNLPTMRWRMLNYYTAIHDRLHGWKDDTFHVDQVVLYFGQEKLNMKGTIEFPRSTRDSPFRYHVDIRDIRTTEDRIRRSLLHSSSSADDWIIATLAIPDAREGDWLALMDRICSLPDVEGRSDGLLKIEQMARLRGFQEMISGRIEGMDVQTALENSALKRHFDYQVAVDSLIGRYVRHFEKSRQSTIPEQDLAVLRSLSLEQVESVFDRVVIDGEHHEDVMGRYYRPGP